MVSGVEIIVFTTSTLCSTEDCQVSQSVYLLGLSNTCLCDLTFLSPHSRNAEALFLSQKGSDEFLETLLRAGEYIFSSLPPREFSSHTRSISDSSQPHILVLRDEILMQITHDLQLSSSLSPHIAKYVLYHHGVT